MDGCDLNTYRLGQTNFYGPGPSFQVDSTQPVTVVTQFITSDNTSTGDLVEIRRLYVQNGKTIPSPTFTIPGTSSSFDSITDSFCIQEETAFAEPPAFESKGGLKRMGDVMDDGMYVTFMFDFLLSLGMHVRCIFLVGGFLLSYHQQGASPVLMG
jgi:cellulose 1,4-beta-cellobiosidase